MKRNSDHVSESCYAHPFGDGVIGDSVLGENVYGANGCVCPADEEDARDATPPDGPAVGYVRVRVLSGKSYG